MSALLRGADCGNGGVAAVEPHVQRRGASEAGDWHHLERTVPDAELSRVTRDGCDGVAGIECLLHHVPADGS